MHGAKVAGRENALHRKEVAIPAAILEDAQKSVGVLCPVDQRATLRRRRREWLVDDDVQPGVERGTRDRPVRRVRRGDDDEVELGCASDQRIGVADDRCAGIVAARRRHALGVAGRDRGEAEPRRRGNQWRVEYRAGESVTGQPDANRFAARTPRPLPDARRRHWQRSATSNGRPSAVAKVKLADSPCAASCPA